MKNPVDSISGTIWSGVILTIVLAFLSLAVSKGYNLAMLIVLILWGVLFGLMRKPTMP
ncbi:MAG TPA: hypothetical protein VMW62_19180 [Chloroflexota bacterium]|nr:hypothetical protein [Chloroflexota bacterium]